MKKFRSTLLFLLAVSLVLSLASCVVVSEVLTVLLVLLQPANIAIVIEAIKPKLKIFLFIETSFLKIGSLFGYRLILKFIIVKD